MRVPPPTMLGALGLRTHEIFYFCSSRSLGCCPTTSLSAPSDRNVGSLWRFGHCACISVPLRGCLAFHFDLHAAVDARVDGFGSVGSSVDCGVEKKLCPEAMAALNACYRFVEEALDMPKRVWPSVKSEIRCAMNLLFLMEADLGAPY